MKLWLKPREFEKQMLEEKGSEVEISDSLEGFDLKELEAISVPGGMKIDRLDGFDGKLVTRSTGYDHIDLQMVEENGLELYNIPDYGCRTVAEHTFSLILSLTKNIQKSWMEKEHEREELRGMELKGRTLGVIGAGSIGKEVLKLGKGFDMDLIAYDPEKDHEAAEEIGYRYVELDQLLEESDIVSVHCPLIPATENLLGPEQFRLMEETVFINTARAEIVDTEALIDGLNDGNVLKAGLDVVKDREEELNDREDTVVTPHNAYNTYKANKRRVEKTLEAMDGKGNKIV